MPKPISKKKCKSLKRVWVKRSNRAKAYCRKKPSRNSVRPARAPRAPRAPVEPMPAREPEVAAREPMQAMGAQVYHYGFRSDMKFVQNETILECDRVEVDIKRFIDYYFRDNLDTISEQFNRMLSIYYGYADRDFPEPELNLDSIRRENCSIRFMFSSNSRIPTQAHRLILDVIDNIYAIFPQEQIRQLFETYQYDMDEFGFTYHLPDYENEANLSDPQYRYQFKVGVVIDDYSCDSREVVDLKENIRDFINQNQERLIRRMTNSLTVAGKNMNVPILRFDVEKCSFNFMIDNGGPLSAVDYNFLSRGHEWEILTEDEFNIVSGDFTVRLNDPFSAEYFRW
jgi:hypothetical protein